MLTVAEEAHRTDTGRQRHANEDSYFARAPAVRRRRRDGRRAGRRGRLADRRRGVRAPRRWSAEQPAEGQLERDRAGRPTARSTSSPRRTPRRAGMGTTLTAAMLRGERGRLRPRRRQPRLRAARRRAQAPDQGPLAGRGAPPPGPAHRGAGRGASAALDHHPRPRARAEREGRHDDLPGPGRRRLPALQRRAHDDGRRRRDPRDPGSLAQPAGARSTSSSTRPTAAGARDNITAVAFRVAEPRAGRARTRAPP